MQSGSSLRDHHRSKYVYPGYLLGKWGLLTRGRGGSSVTWGEEDEEEDGDADAEVQKVIDELTLDAVHRLAPVPVAAMASADEGEELVERLRGRLEKIE